MRPSSLRFLSALTACVAALLTAPAAWAQSKGASSDVGVSTQIDTPAASIGVVQNLTFSISPQSLQTGLTITSSAANGVNANIVLRGAGGDTVSLSVPATISVTRNGGVDTVTVRTVGAVTNVTDASGAQVTGVPGLTGGANGAFTGVASGGLFTGPVTVTGNLDSGVLSFTVAGVVTVANDLVPGDYHGVLTVVAQYN